MIFTLSGQQTISPGVIVMPGAILAGQPVHLGEMIPDSFLPSVSGLARPVGSRVFTRGGSASYLKVGTATTAWAAASGVPPAPLWITLTDATATSPDVLVLQHVGTGVPAGLFGATWAVELNTNNGGGVVAATTRAMVDNTFWFISTLGSTLEARRTISLRIANAITEVISFSSYIGGAPAVYFGSASWSNLIRSTSGGMSLVAGGSTVSTMSSTGFDLTVASRVVTASTSYTTPMLSLVGSSASGCPVMHFYVNSTTLVGGLRADASGNLTWFAKGGNHTFYFGGDFGSGTPCFNLDNIGRATFLINGIGFNGAAATVKPTITGSRGANAALASLLTALATYGLVTDSTT